MSVSRNSATSIEQYTRITQIIIGALIAGVTIFLLIVVYLVHFAGFPAHAILPAAPGQVAGPNAPGAAGPARGAAAGQNPSRSIPILTYLSVGVALTLLPLSFILPNVIARQSLRTADARGSGGSSNPSPSVAGAANPAFAFQKSAIVGAALIEGPAFLAALAYLIEQNPIAIGVFLALLVALILQFPTRERVERWIVLQEEKLRSRSSG